MTALLLTAALVSQPPTPPAGGRDAAGNSIDGTWTVVAFEKNGQPMAEAKDARVTVRNNTVTFEGKEKMKAMRITFMPNGMLRVTETDAAGAGGTGTGTTDRTGGAGTGGAGQSGGAGQQGGTGTANRPGATGSQADSKMGVYVLTGDYFAICLHDDNRGSGGAGTGAGGSSTGGAGSGSSAGGGTGTGGAGTGSTQGGAGAGTGAGSSAAGATGSGPVSKTYCNVILRRAGAAGGTGTGTDRR